MTSYKSDNTSRAGPGVGHAKKRLGAVAQCIMGVHTQRHTRNVRVFDLLFDLIMLLFAVYVPFIWQPVRNLFALCACFPSHSPLLNTWDSSVRCLVNATDTRLCVQIRIPILLLNSCLLSVAAGQIKAYALLHRRLLCSDTHQFGGVLLRVMSTLMTSWSGLNVDQDRRAVVNVFASNRMYNADT